MTERNFGMHGTLEYHDITLKETDDENILGYIYTEGICKKVPKGDSKTVLVARMLWLPPWLADWPITHAHDTEHTSRVPCQQRTIQPGSTTE